MARSGQTFGAIRTHPLAHPHLLQYYPLYIRFDGCVVHEVEQEKHVIRSPIGPVMQLAYLVEDLDSAIAQWMSLGVGPFFVSRDANYKDQLYKGQPVSCRFSLALAYTGELQVELIQLLDDQPSSFSAFKDAHGYGLHHLGVLTKDIDGDLAKLEGLGHQVVHRMTSPLEVQTAYVDVALPGGASLELIQESPTLEAGFYMMRQMTAEWDGGTPGIHEF